MCIGLGGYVVCIGRVVCLGRDELTLNDLGKVDTQ